MKSLRVSDNRRFLVTEDGEPFFYLGDTAWELFHRLSREDADYYLENRAARRFTVIQAVVLAEHEYERPNFYGHLPLKDNDPTKPVEAYFQHVDAIVNKAESLGMFVGMLPTWGDKWNRKWGGGPEIFTPENAHIFGKWLGKRYKDKPILWILGGDRPVDTEAHRAILVAMAEGLKAGDGGRHLRTFHPMGQESSAPYFHNDDWLDFNMIQSGHSRNRDNYRSIAEDYARTPIKPCMDAEPGYEDHPSGFKVENGYLDQTDVRKSLYWSLFAGAFGYTYGCHDIWQFLQPGWKPISWGRTPWKEAADFPGAAQLQYARNLLESRPFLTRIPDQSLLVSDPLTGGDHIQATRDSEGRYAFVYSASGHPFTVDTTKLGKDGVKAYWYDPRDGDVTPIGAFPNSRESLFTPPSVGIGNDWVLVLDAVGQEFPPPGARGDRKA